MHIGIGIGIPTTTGAVVSSGGESSPLLTDLVSYWKLDEASGVRYDSHGSKDLTDVNTVGQSTGKIDSSALFVRANSEFLRYNSGGLEPGAGSWTGSMWVNFTTVGSENPLISSGGFSFPSFNVRHNGTAWVLYVIDSATVTATYTHTPSTGTWYHVAGVIDKTLNMLYLYLNGAQVASASIAGAGLDTFGVNWNFSLGKHQQSSQYLNGLLDEVGIWSRALTSDEVADLYNSGAGLAYPFAA